MHVFLMPSFFFYIKCLLAFHFCPLASITSFDKIKKIVGFSIYIRQNYV